MRADSIARPTTALGRVRRGIHLIEAAQDARPTIIMSDLEAGWELRKELGLAQEADLMVDGVAVREMEGVTGFPALSFIPVAVQREFLS